MNNPSITSLDFADMAPLHNLLRHIIPLVPKLPQAMAMDLLRQKYIDFARRSRILACEITKDYQAGVVDYYLDAPDKHEIYTITGIEGGLFGSYWVGQSITQFTRNFDVIDNNCIKLRSVPSVDQAKGLTIYVNLLPSECIDVIPRSIVTPFGRQIARGVVSDVLYMPNKDWTNEHLGRRYELEYEKMLLSARAVSVSNRKIDSASFKPIRIL